MISTLAPRFLSPEEVGALGFAECGSDVLIDETVRIVGAGNLHLGSHVRIDAHVLIVASIPLRIGSWVHIAAYCCLEGGGGIEIGDFVGLSSYTCLQSASDDFSGRALTGPTVPSKYKSLDSGAIVIERHGLVGIKSTLLPGVRINEGGVLGAHSLAKCDVPAWTICVGVPARPIRERSRDLLALEAQLRADGAA
ncbi:MAG: acyltransferase [Novosphingobium sp.]